MPRGNDPEAAEEFEKEYGVQGNAESLIQQGRTIQSRELTAASLGRLDPVATNALDLDKVEKALDLEDEQTVLSAAARGGNVIALVENEDGRVNKQVLSREDAGLTDAALKASREALGLPEVAVGEIKYRDEEESAVVADAREADTEEREAREAREEKRAKAAEKQTKAAEKERAKSSKSDD